MTTQQLGSSRSTAAIFLAGLLMALAASAQPSSCLPTGEPGATMLIPYFEVDLEQPDGRNTLFSVNNASNEAAVAHVVLWTNIGIPTYTFDLYLAADDVVNISLRDVLDLAPPQTGPGTGNVAGFPGCADPIALPVFDPFAAATLKARHRGRPDPVDGMCYGIGDSGDELATGFVTIDVVNDCSETLELPTDDGYFVDGGNGLASNRNVLWGDVLLIDPGEDFAQGFAAPAVRADPSIGSGTSSFYGFVTGSSASNRRPLAGGYRTRFLAAGAFDASTDLILWNDGSAGIAPFDCAGNPEPSTNFTYFSVQAYDRGGALELFTNLAGAPWRTRRVPVGGDELPVDATSGHFEMLSIYGGPLLDPPLIVQSWIAPVISAAGRFSVSLKATPTVAVCSPQD